METIKNNIIKIKALKKASWSGFSRFPKCKDTVVASLGRGGYNTGLDLEEQAEIEKAMRLKEGELSKNSSFWKDYTVHIPAGEVFELDLSIPKDRIDLALLKNSRKVANSIQEYNEGLWPKALYVIHDIQEEAKVENIKVQTRKKAWKKFASMSIADMKEVLKLMGYKADNLLDEVVENTLNTKIEEDPEEFNRITGIDNFKIRILIEDLLGKNLLRKVGSKYYYADDIIGYSIDETISYLTDPKNQEILITLKDKLESKSKS
jgi:hypothetical protein